MSFKLFFIQKLSLFFMLTTLITVAVWAVGTVFDADASFGYDGMLTPLFYAACCVIPTFVTYSKRELTPKELMVRMGLELILIEAVMLGLAFRSPEIDTSRVSVILVIGGSVLIIYFLTRFFSWLRNSAEAKALNTELLRFQQLHNS